MVDSAHSRRCLRLLCFKSAVVSMICMVGSGSYLEFPSEGCMAKTWRLTVLVRLVGSFSEYTKKNIEKKIVQKLRGFDGRQCRFVGKVDAGLCVTGCR